MKKWLKAIIQKIPSLYLFIQIFLPRLKVVKGDLQSVHDAFTLKNNQDTIAVDLGCGPKVTNRFSANKALGVDLFQDNDNGVLKCRLGFEKLPFDDNAIDYLTAYDLLEHIPRYSDREEIGHAPFIFLLNECYRVLRKGGVFLSMTPIYPYLGAFQDPTNNNIMTVHTLEKYFTTNKHAIASHYGITANFNIKYQRMLGEHLIAVLEK
ncbi:MAG: methyltransferase domain-containing protein [SAR86 cluster bacterium]|nr:methyltransferase domain-containing protein [SAR86 cluster bacterium]